MEITSSIFKSTVSRFGISVLLSLFTVYYSTIRLIGYNENWILLRWVFSDSEDLFNHLDVRSINTPHNQWRSTVQSGECCPPKTDRLQTRKIYSIRHNTFIHSYVPDSSIHSWVSNAWFPNMMVLNLGKSTHHSNSKQLTFQYKVTIRKTIGIFFFVSYLNQFQGRESTQFKSSTIVQKAVCANYNGLQLTTIHYIECPIHSICSIFYMEAIVPNSQRSQRLHSI